MADEMGGASPWPDAALAACLLAIDPVGLGGASVRVRPGPARDAWLALLRAALPEDVSIRRVPLNIADLRLLGGLDLPATLAAGRPVAQRGLLAETDGGVLLLAMAERIEASIAARIVAVMDDGEVRTARDGIEAVAPARLCVVALDEGADEEEVPPAALLDRLAFQLDLAPVTLADVAGVIDADVRAARAILPDVVVGEDLIEAIAGASIVLGIASLRAPILAMRAARAAAALDGRRATSQEDAALAARLVLAARATRMPACEPAPEEENSAEDDPPPEPPPPEEAPEDSAEADDDRPPPDLSDIVLEAASSAIPKGLLERLKAGVAPRTGRGDGAGQMVRGMRGRPAGIRAGPPGPNARLNLLETLRAAAPWQRLRGGGAGARLQIRADDFRVTHYRQRRESTAIFVVDASGSAALNRLAEAKGAVELLLADCYVRRDSVALIAFRGASAEVILPPTRSLVRARRGLAGLPGGGGTPMATAIDAAGAMAEAIRRRGGTPSLVFLTDGQANIARDGTPGRGRAQEDAMAASRRLAATGLGAIMVDTSPPPRGRAVRPSVPAQELAGAMRASYIALPQASAQSLNAIVRAVRSES